MDELKFTKLSSKGQVVIPRSIREVLNLEAGNLLAVKEQGEMVLLKKIQIPEVESKFKKEEPDITKIKPKIVKILKNHNITKAGIFGSYAIGEARQDSDIDILIEPPRKRKFSLFDLVALERKLGEKLGIKVDLLTYDGINPLLKKIILGEEVKII